VRNDLDPSTSTAPATDFDFDPDFEPRPRVKDFDPWVSTVATTVLTPTSKLYARPRTSDLWNDLDLDGVGAVHLSTSGQASPPGEFKHINDRRKRN